MKKILIIFMSIISFSNTDYVINKVIYNNKEDNFRVFLNSNIEKGNKLNINDIDTLVENFKFAKNNEINVNIEPTEERDKVNLIVTNTKKNPLSLSFIIDNYDETNKLKYTLDAKLSGLILNENIDLSYTFTPNEKNNNFLLQFSFPIKHTQSFFTYSYKDYERKITGNNDVYTVGGNTNRFNVKLKTLLYRNKEERYSIYEEYTHIFRKSYLEDVELNKEHLNDIKVGLEYIKGKTKLDTSYTYNIEEMKSKIDSEIKLGKKDLTFNLLNHIEENNNRLDLIFDIDLKNIYLNMGMHSDFKNVNPIIKLGIKQDIWKFNIDCSLNYEKEFKALFKFKFNIF